MKIRYDNKHSGVTKKVGDIKLGTVFSGLLSDTSKIYLKTLGRAVDLQKLQICWNNSAVVYDYIELDVELLVKGEK